MLQALKKLQRSHAGGVGELIAMSGDEAMRALQARSSSKVISRTATMPMENLQAPHRTGSLRQTSLAQAGQRTFGMGMGILEDARSQVSNRSNVLNEAHH